MKFALDDYIDEYIKEADGNDKTVARHLKEIIPRTAHLNRETFKEIIEELKKETNKGENFKSAFLKVCPKYILTGDVIKAKLPGFLMRIYLNKNKFLLYLKKMQTIPYSTQKIGMILASRNKKRITRLLSNVELSKKKVVFATFDERGEDKDPFLNYKVIQIINMLALNKDVYHKDEPYTAIKIRYENRKHMVKKYPTFIDAGWYDKFFPAKKYDRYGRTKSLDSSLPNMPEIVHENLIISDVIEDIEFLKD